jgi:hypothetical protein
MRKLTLHVVRSNRLSVLVASLALFSLALSLFTNASVKLGTSSERSSKTLGSSTSN